MSPDKILHKFSYLLAMLAASTISETTTVSVKVMSFFSSEHFEQSYGLTPGTISKQYRLPALYCEEHRLEERLKKGISEHMISELLSWILLHNHALNQTLPAMAELTSAQKRSVLLGVCSRYNEQDISYFFKKTSSKQATTAYRARITLLKEDLRINTTGPNIFRWVLSPSTEQAIRLVLAHLMPGTPPVTIQANHHGKPDAKIADKPDGTAKNLHSMLL